MQLVAAGATGNGSSPTVLSAAGLITDASGGFSVPAGYPCPDASSELYLLARGGAPASGGSGGQAIALLGVVGACSQVVSGERFTVDEVTTAAGVWALAQFLSPNGSVGSTPGNSRGLANASRTAALLADMHAGTAPGSPATAAPATARINTLANLLNGCTAAASAAAAGCLDLFARATVAPSGAPATTLAAALSMVRNPGNNVGALFMLANATSPFQPALAAAPADWTLFIQRSGGGLRDPAGLGIDSAGNVWAGSFSGVASKFSPTGVPVFPSGITGAGLNASYGLAVDASDNVWVPNREGPSSVNGGLGSVTVLSSAGQPLSGAAGFAQGGLNYPISVAIDRSTTAWVVDYGNSHLTLLSASGQPLSGASGYTSPLFSFPVAVAVDASGNGWVANQASAADGSGNVTRVSSDGARFTNFKCCNGASGLALDASGNVWVANYYGSSVSLISGSCGTVLSSGFTGGGLSYPQGIAVDGAGSVWVANFRGPSITQLAGSLTPQPGMPLSPAVGWAPDAMLSQGYALAIDGSGNIWVTNFSGGTLTEFVGLAAPVRTPLLGGVQVP